MTNKNRLFVLSLSFLIVFGNASAQKRDVSKMYELPAYSSSPFFYSAYTVQFNTKTNIPDWVAWKLDKRRLNDKKVSRLNKFKPDPALGQSSPTHDDYTNSGYDRGHMCPANNCLQSGEAVLESFYMSNVCPQRSDLNKGSWATLEEKCGSWLVDNFYSELYIVCGPIPQDVYYTKITGTDKDIYVPDRFFKAIIGKKTKGGYAGIAFVFAQDGEATPMSIDQLELKIHMDLFVNMPSRITSKAERMQPNLSDWPDYNVIRKKRK